MKLKARNSGGVMTSSDDKNFFVQESHTRPLGFLRFCANG
jgi:hypothetical protein